MIYLTIFENLNLITDLCNCMFRQKQHNKGSYICLTEDKTSPNSFAGNHFDTESLSITLTSAPFISLKTTPLKMIGDLGSSHF